VVNQSFAAAISHMVLISVLEFIALRFNKKRAQG
jgi:hypothetical protein